MCFDSILVDRTFKRSQLAFTLVITIIIIIFASHFLVAFITAQYNGLSSNYYYFYFFFFGAYLPVILWTGLCKNYIFLCHMAYYYAFFLLFFRENDRVYVGKSNCQLKLRGMFYLEKCINFIFFPH